MGSGLILLVIVGAWLAVLVPMALRSHDATSSRSVDRFSDAVRVLSRRVPRVVGHAARGRSGSGGDGQQHEPGASLPSLEPLLHEVRDEVRPPVPLVVRRRRVLGTLAGSALACLLLALVVGPLLWVGLALAGLAVAYVVHLRRLAVARRRAPRVRLPRPLHVEGIPSRMPPRPSPLAPPAPVEEPVRWEEPLALPLAAGAEHDPLPETSWGTTAGSAWDYGSTSSWGASSGRGGSWSPVPVPPPAWATRPAAPSRSAYVPDAPAGAGWTAPADLELGADADVELDEILERRRAVGDW